MHSIFKASLRNPKSMRFLNFVLITRTTAIAKRSTFKVQLFIPDRAPHLRPRVHLVSSSDHPKLDFISHSPDLIQ
jgi:hypothetical protein